MARLRAAVEASPLTLDDGRDTWLEALRGWLGTMRGDGDDPPP